MHPMHLMHLSSKRCTSCTSVLKFLPRTGLYALLTRYMRITYLVLPLAKITRVEILFDLAIKDDVRQIWVGLISWWGLIDIKNFGGWWLSRVQYGPIYTHLLFGLKKKTEVNLKPGFMVQVYTDWTKVRKGQAALAPTCSSRLVMKR
jgi:hypothetical protein